ncbi:hypothetical protein HHL17_28215 [Chitinophaga sp. G-6-1-13]|uniref:Uncharacterized protein n=1 Tax=Chitinophaga fulva TaxID=2728842 RepID=A0A848GVA0_9BACT|nr:hypothetical protein [Chitinophaga fulva]NML41112.1 hypothetical protein [Chitinophaga fulva]
MESMKDCDWSHKEGGLVSYSTNYNNGKTTALFVYDCKSRCGNFRFKLVYSLDGVAPELTDMNVERPLGK